MPGSSAVTQYPHGFNAYLDLNQLPEYPEKEQRFAKLKSLGNALYGKVYLMEDRLQGGVVAMKKMPKGIVLAGLKGVECAKNEIAASVSLQNVVGPHNIKCLGAAQDAQHFYLATEYCEHGELFNVLTKASSISDESILRKAMWQILVAIRALHRNGVAHRDVSVENVFVASDGTLRLGDYGQAVVVAPPTTAAQGEEAGAGAKATKTPQEEAVFTEHLTRRHLMPGKVYYRPPEMFVSRYEARPFDIYSCGVILYALRFGNYPFEKAYPSFLYPKEQAAWATETRCTKLQAQLTELKVPAISPAMLDFMELMLAGDPKSRPTADEALLHPWITGSAAGMWLMPAATDVEESTGMAEEPETESSPVSFGSSELELAVSELEEAAETEASAVGKKRPPAEDAEESRRNADDEDMMSDVSTEVGEETKVGVQDWQTPPTSPWEEEEVEDEEKEEKDEGALSP